MKRILIAAVLVAFACSAFAANSSQTFVPYSAAGAKTVTSAAINARGYTIKSVSVTGIKNTASPTTFKNMSGTLTTECGPTTNGPWATCVANDYAQTAVSRTTNGIFTWRDAFAYVRLKWITTGNTRNYIKAWLNWAD